MENLSLRTTAAGADEEFLMNLFFDVRRDEFEAAGLPFEQIKILLRMQYAAQKQSYEASYPNAENRIIEIDGDKIGRLLICNTGEKTHLIDIAILRQYRGRGLGSYFIEKLKAGANAVSLSVYKGNAGAIRLYEQHGFQFLSEDGMYYQMEWRNA